MQLPGKALGWLGAAVAAIVCGYLIIGSLVLTLAASRLLSPEVLLEAFDMPERPSDPLTLGFRGDPASAFGMDFTILDVETPLGAAPAWWIPTTHTYAPVAAIYVHGVAGAREDGYRHLSMLHEYGLPVLLISYRNDVDAPQAPHGRYAMGVEEWADLDAAAAHLLAEGYSGFVLVFESMGGAICGHFLRHSPHAERVAGLALDSPALQFEPILQTVGEAIGLPFAALLARPALWMLSLSGPTDFSSSDLIDVVARFDGPLFLAHGRGDTAVPFAISERLLARREGPVIFVETEADHLQSYTESPSRYRGAFFGFLDTIE